MEHRVTILSKHSRSPITEVTRRTPRRRAPRGNAALQNPARRNFGFRDIHSRRGWNRDLPDPRYIPASHRRYGYPDFSILQVISITLPLFLHVDACLASCINLLWDICRRCDAKFYSGVFDHSGCGLFYFSRHLAIADGYSLHLAR